MNQNSDFFYHQKIYGDKDTFNLAWNKFKVPFLLYKEVKKIHGIFIHETFYGKFYHQNDAKKKDSSKFSSTISIHNELNGWRQTYIDWLISEEVTELYTINF